MSCRIIKHKRGTRLIIPFRLRYSGYDWVNTRFRMQLRESDDAPQVVTFDSGGGSSNTSFSGSVVSPGVFEGQFIAEHPVTRDWPDVLIGDLWVYRASPVFGPYVVLPFELHALTPRTETSP